MTDTNDKPRRIRADRLKRQRDLIASVVPLMTDSMIRVVEKRSEYDASPDGYRSNTRLGPIVSVGNLEMDETPPQSSTESAALRLVDGHRARDPQMLACERIDRSMKTMADAAKELAAAWALVLNITDMRRGRETSLGSCLACLRDDIPNQGEDRIRSGYCPACYRAWMRTGGGSGRQDRMSFEKSRREVVVDEMSPPPDLP